MADSSSRLGLCITVRPGNHKAGSVEDLRWGEGAKYRFKLLFFLVVHLWSFTYSVHALSAVAILKKDAKEARAECLLHGKQFQSRLSPTVSAVKDRRIQRYTAGWRQPGMSFFSLSVRDSPSVFSWQPALQGDMTWKCSSALFGLPVTSSLLCSSSMHGIINSSCTVCSNIPQWKIRGWVIAGNWDY